MELSYRQYVRVANIVRRFSEATHLVEKIDSEPVTDGSTFTRATSCVIHLDKTVFSSAEERDVPMYWAGCGIFTRS